MLQILCNFVFKIISVVGNIILLPFTTALSLLVPDVSGWTSYITTFFETVGQYFSFILNLICVPSECILAIFTFAGLYLSIQFVLQTYSLILKIYTFFKP